MIPTLSKPIDGAITQSYPTPTFNTEIKRPQYKCIQVSQPILAKLSDPENLKVHFSLSELNALRASSPVSTLSIRMQAILYKQLRKAKSVLAFQNSLDPYQCSADKTTNNSEKNKVFRIHCSEQTLGYYKTTKSLPSDNGIMEMLMWQIAVIMGIEEFFVPTTSVALRTRPLLQEIDNGIPQKIWVNKRHSLKNKTLSPIVKGSFQPAQTGIDLNRYLNPTSQTKKNQKPISKSHLIKASLAIILMGLFDAHSGNFLIDKNGCINFFDNTRAMPHSNNCIIGGKNQLLTSFKSSLLFHSGNFIPLNQEDRALIFAEIEKYKIRYDDLIVFFENPITKAMVNQIPPDWLNIDQSLKAMERRIINIEKGLKNPKVTNLCELTLSSQLQLKFFAAIQLLSCVLETPSITRNIRKIDLNFFFLIKLQQQTLHLIGSEPLKKTLLTCARAGFDLISLKKRCSDLDIGFKEIISDLIDDYISGNGKIDSEMAIKNAGMIHAELLAHAKKDLKDF